MFISLVLVIHIVLAFSIGLAFVVRYILALKNKRYPERGRIAVFAGSIGLVISGVLLSVIAKLPITKLCLESLGIVVALLVMEFGLQKLSGSLAAEKDRSEKN